MVQHCDSKRLLITFVSKQKKHLTAAFLSLKQCRYTLEDVSPFKHVAFENSLSTGNLGFFGGTPHAMDF